MIGKLFIFVIVKEIDVFIDLILFDIVMFVVFLLKKLVLGV